MKRTIILALLGILTCPLFASSGLGSVIYVNHAASGMNNGSSWDDAYIDLSDALAVAENGMEIWVAQGVYTPGPDTTSSFVLNVDAKLYGGFVGDEDDLDDRVFWINKVFLSGDLNGDDIPGDLVNNRSDNALTVFILGDLSEAAVIDGFYIQGGHSDGDDIAFENRRGGGVFSYGNASMTNCRFEDNYADASGGALYLQGPEASGMIIQTTSFTNNSANHGGAVGVSYCAGAESVEFSLCSFFNNSANQDGGAIRVFDSSVKYSDCEFEGNAAGRNGGAVEIRNTDFYLVNEFENSEFLANSAGRGGAIRWNTGFGLGASYNEVYISDCFFDGNLATQVDPEFNQNRIGGALSINIGRTTVFSKVAISASEFTNNQSDNHGGAIRMDIAGPLVDVSIETSTFEYNYAGSNSTIYVNANDIASGSFSMHSCGVKFNSSDDINGGLFLRNRDFTDMEYDINTCSFNENSANASGGGLSIHNLQDSQVDMLFTNCTFYENSCGASGAAMTVSAENDGLNTRFLRCYFEENVSQTGTVLMAEPTNVDAPMAAGSRLLFDNCIINENLGNSIFSLDSFPALELINCTVAYNEGTIIEFIDASNVLLQNSILENPGQVSHVDLGGNGEVASYGGNFISDNSMLLGGADETDISAQFSIIGFNEYELSETSPCIDAGILPADWPEFDAYGMDRVQGGGIDAGASESPYVTSVDNIWLSSFNAKLSPNPASDLSILNLNVEKASTWNLTLFDLSGKLLWEKKVEHGGGAAQYEIPVANLANGNYLLRLKNGLNATGLNLQKH